MENCNYDRMEMMAFNMVRQGLFGEILHAEGGYLHDLRAIKFEQRRRGALAPRLGHEARTATCIRRTASGRSPTASTSTAAIASTIWSR